MEDLSTWCEVSISKWLSKNQLDVKSAFLNGFLEEEIYVDQPLRYVEVNNEGKVYKLEKALYGLKQAPRVWNTRIDMCFQENKFERYPY